MALPGMGYGRALLAENLLDPRENDAGRSKSGRKLLHPARLTAANRRYVTNGRRIIKETGRTRSGFHTNLGHVTYEFNQIRLILLSSNIPGISLNNFDFERNRDSETKVLGCINSG